MDEKNKMAGQEVEIDLGRLLRTILDRAWMVAIVSLLCAVLTLVGTFCLVSPKYESSAMFYVNNGSLSLGDTSLSLSSGDLSASRNLVESYIVILNTRESLNDVIDYAGVDRSYSELKKMISAEAVSDTEIFRVTVTSPDPVEAEKIAAAIAYILPNRIADIIENSSAKVVDKAVLPSEPSSPNYITNTIVGFLIGFVMVVGIIVLRELFDITIRTEEDVEQSCKHPILAEVPNMTAPTKGVTTYGDSRRRGKYAAVSQAEKTALMGPDISFAASEAYKLLRTKLQFSFADEGNCRVIGLSSALSGEGKSLTAVNLAYAMAQLDKKVLLVDCDMRRPTLASKLGLLKYPGLSNYLTRQCGLEELVQTCEIKDTDHEFHVISAGENPPNPVELLSSERMKKALNAMRQTYDYVILDLPPVGEVSDAMTIAKETDGILLVVRQNYCDRLVLSDAVRQFAFIDTRILGVVYNCTTEHSGKYGKSYYKRYHKYYGARYAKNDRRVANAKNHE